MTKLEFLKIQQKIERRLLHIKQLLDYADLRQKGEQDMAVSSDTAALINEFDVATDAVAARISKLVAAQTGLSADDKAAFQSEINKLTAMGKDPDNPTDN